jgi:hypothetical protein
VSAERVIELLRQGEAPAPALVSTEGGAVSFEGLRAAVASHCSHPTSIAKVTDDGGECETWKQ